LGNMSKIGPKLAPLNHLVEENDFLFFLMLKWYEQNERTN